jgi:hypothetical protein
MDRMSGMLALVACAGMALAASTAQAAESKVTVVTAGSATDAMKVVRDKDTGKIRAATPEEMESMAGTRSLAPNVVVLSRPVTTMVSRPDGSATIRRSVDDLDSVVMERGTDGKLSMRHGGKHAAAAPATPTAPKE